MATAIGLVIALNHLSRRADGAKDEFEAIASTLLTNARLA